MVHGLIDTEHLNCPGRPDFDISRIRGDLRACPLTPEVSAKILAPLLFGTEASIILSCLAQQLIHCLLQPFGYGYRISPVPAKAGALNAIFSDVQHASHVAEVSRLSRPRPANLH